MTQATAPPPAKPLPPPSKAPPPAANGAPKRALGVGGGVKAACQIVVTYGPGGSGKSTLCSLVKELGLRPLFVDIERGTGALDVLRVEPDTFQEVRDVLHDDAMWANHDVAVVDSLTKLEEITLRHVLDTIKTEGGKTATSIESYGFGKGFSYVYEAFLQVLGDLDRLQRMGKHILCTAHECTASVPNPSGEDFIRYEPRLQSPKSGKASIRHKVKEWCDHLLFIGYDVAVSEEGKGLGGGTRTIYPCEMPTHWAKTRKVGLRDNVIYTEGSTEIWKKLFNKE